jgi:hypothetical protein
MAHLEKCRRCGQRQVDPKIRVPTNEHDSSAHLRRPARSVRGSSGKELGLTANADCHLPLHSSWSIQEHRSTESKQKWTERTIFAAQRSVVLFFHSSFSSTLHAPSLTPKKLPSFCGSWGLRCVKVCRNQSDLTFLFFWSKPKRGVSWADCARVRGPHFASPAGPTSPGRN